MVLYERTLDSRALVGVATSSSIGHFTSMLVNVVIFIFVGLNERGRLRFIRLESRLRIVGIAIAALSGNTPNRSYLVVCGMLEN